ncbi:GGDEF domain-containing response regulator [Solidesulfovibrio magneticus]|uniref:diguanylate cyclase n=1 Tax=Solidesulfovibrio magneticus (strain ATCC 700980 / DSM 13731 / RS-1) TaxID=573370 RepID=C4XNA6_SOLM1|nr:diguanylate cyclase [Solidesulfovibrio magneticus]BAH77409.1 response regulator receiver protein [Solidesulfovibrio magneticus RS-1]
MNQRKNLPQGLRGLRSLHILVAEDDRFAREQLSLLLSRFAGRVSTAADGMEGLDAFKYDRPDIVVTDINMPRLSGLDMAQAIKAMDPSVPVILVTAHSDAQFFLRSIEIGIDGYVIKPLDADSLLKLLAKQAAVLLEARAAEARAGMFRFILDINPNFILTLGGESLDYVNRTFLDFLGATDLAALRDSRHAGRVLELDGRAFDPADLAWTKLLDLREGRTHQAVFAPPPASGERERTFLVSAVGFPELDRTIITFTDITPLAEERRILRIRAATDALTGIANRAGLAEALEREFHRSQRHPASLSVIIFDIDHFKNVNDAYGHPAGDAVLAELTRLVTTHVRDHDTFGRYGGEEFLIIAPGTDVAEAAKLAERLRSDVARHGFPAVGSLTCSFGVAVAGPDDTPDSLVARADTALYDAKQSGRDRVVAR